MFQVYPRGSRRTSAANPKRHNPPLLHVHGRGWIQESYDTGSPELRRRAKSLRAAGYSVNSFSLGSQVTQWGRAKLTMLDIRPGSSGDPYLENVGRQDNPKRPANRFWPLPYEVDQAINKRAQAMARTGKQFTRADSDDYADRLIRALYGRNAMIADSERDKIRRLLWSDYQDYPAGFKGFHRTAAGKRTERARVGYMRVWQGRAAKSSNPKPRGLKRLPASRMWALQRKTGQGWDTRVVGPDRRSIEGTTRWYQDNYPPASQWRSVQLGSQDNPSIRDSKKRWIKELHKHWPGLSKEAELKERAALSRILKGAGKTPRALRARSKFNPSSRSLLYDVTVPPTASERGYQFTIRARTAGAALREARRYCARNAGMTAAGYKLPRGSSARVMQTR